MPVVTATERVLAGTFPLTVHPSVVFKLGEDLITDDVQALTELIKNAYDADSPSVAVDIDTRVWTMLDSGRELDPGEASDINAQRTGIGVRLDELRTALDNLVSDRATQSGKVADSPDLAVGNLEAEIHELREELMQLPEPVRGRIRVVDRGTGMSLEDISRDWLTVSASRKKGMKERGQKTDRHSRTPLGDKGLGRLGAQRLGRVLTLTTRQAAPKNSPALSAKITWDDFLVVESLAEIPILVEQVSEDLPVGSVVQIDGLRNPDGWLSKNSYSLERDLSTMISPYGNELGFKVYLTIDNDAIDLGERSSKIVEKASVSYALDYRDLILDVRARISIDYFRPFQGQELIAEWERIIEADNGYDFLSWLLETEPERSGELELEHGDDLRFCSVHRPIMLTEIKLAETTEGMVTSPDGEQVTSLADPGPFSAQVDLVPLYKDPTNVFDKVKEYSDFVKAISGIRVYRDGFGIRVSKDWLDLAEQWSSAKSWYTVRPENVIGHIDLTSEHNAALEETSDREDFKDTPAYRNWMKLLGQWLSFTELVQSFLRREYNKYRAHRASQVVGIDASSSPERLVDAVKQQLVGAGAVAAAIPRARKTLGVAQSAVVELDKQQQSLETNLFADPSAVKSNANALASAKAALNDLQSAVELIEKEADQISGQRAALDLLVMKLKAAEAQVRDVWEVVSLGLTAESVAHEVLNVTDRLKARSAQISKYLSSHPDERFGAYVHTVRSASSSLAQQVSHLDASLRYVRDRREQLRLSDLLKESVNYFNSRWDTKTLRAELEVVKDIELRASRGKLSQVFDNLLLNGQYWVKAEIQSGHASTGRVTIRVDSPFVTVQDTGPGVADSIQYSLFDPFVTNKPARIGRGLGLFVAKQLLDSEGISIVLDQARNKSGRRYIFRLNFSAALEE